MKTCDLTQLNVGDNLAIEETARDWSGRTFTAYRLLVVERVAAQQVMCVNAKDGSGDYRFRKTDGKRIGKEYSYAVPVTQELMATIESQRSLMKRQRDVREALQDLEGKCLHQLKLTLEQAEALAKAWGEIKAMGGESS